jgi:hypothetical protein
MIERELRGCSPDIEYSLHHQKKALSTSASTSSSAHPSPSLADSKKALKPLVGSQQDIEDYQNRLKQEKLKEENISLALK